MTPSVPLTTLLRANILANELATSVAAKIPKNPPFCSFTLFSTISQTLFINKPESLRALTILVISCISSF